MKLLLLAVNAKYIHTNPALYALRQYAIQYADQIVLREYTINHELDAILQGIYEVHPDILCISCYIWNIRIVRELVSDYRKIDPDVRIYLGGPEVSYDAPDCLRRMPELTGIMAGEGEATFLELVRSYTDLLGEEQEGAQYNREISEHEEEALGRIRGLVFRRMDGTIQENPCRELLDFAKLPFPYADMENLGGFEHKIIYYETSRGCPFSCCYCLSSVEKMVRFRNLALVRQELQIFLDNKVAQVKFVDRTFNCNKQHAMGIWQYILEHDNGITNFHFEIAADLLDEEEIELLSGMRPGQVQLEIGIQSTNPDTIAAIRRRMDIEKVAAAVERIREGRNIHQHLDLIAGLPYEGYDSFRKSFDDVYRMKPDQLQLGFLKVLKGSAMAEMAAEHQVKYKSGPPYEVLSTKYLSYGEILRLKEVEEMTEVYYNSGQFVFSLPYLERYFSGPFAMFEALAGYYREHGLFECRQNRMERYEILYRFFGETDTGENSCACFAELLILDLYSREKIKSQPSFAPGYAEDKELIRRLLKNAGVGKEQAGQYYVGHFRYDVLRASAAGELLRRDNYLLFDYTGRDPLNGCCRITVCDLCSR